MARGLDKPTHYIVKIDEVNTVEDVIREFDEIIAWSIDAKTPIGYFAVIYKQATVAIRDANAAGKFEKPERMRQLQLEFARRYFTALNAYNEHGGDFELPTHVWYQSFKTNEKNEPIIFQHLLTGLNAHMNLDLGVAAAQVGREYGMPSLRKDFDVVNAVLGNQVEGVLDAMSKISPGVERMRNCLLGEVEIFRALIILFREKAWRFANDLFDDPDRNEELIETQDTDFDNLGNDYLYTPDLFDSTIRWIAEQESRDVAYNIAVLNRTVPAGWGQIAEYQGALDEVARKEEQNRQVAIDEDDGFLERTVDELRRKAIGFLRGVLRS